MPVEPGLPSRQLLDRHDRCDRGRTSGRGFGRDRDIAALRPDAVSIDIELKAGSGFDVLEALAINNDEGNAPLRIVLTNYTTDLGRHFKRLVRIGIEA